MAVETGRLAPEAVQSMFDRIAPVYDAMNRAMTVGLDRRWREQAARAVVRPGARVLDVCCGTGDLALADARAGGRVTAVDFAPRMLERARAKSDEIEWVLADALDLPFADGSFDAVTVGFGVRNLGDLERGLRELRRILVPGGGLAILEITEPRGRLRSFYRLWFDRLIPLAGKLLRAGAAYEYLPASVRRFPPPVELAELIRAASFDGVEFRLFAGGIVALHTGSAA
jgi:demethylmenaquinone methyltransferase/2-methoxy-6-polyprenyl-1,4-benzoquinol methylase